MVRPSPFWPFVSALFPAPVLVGTTEKRRCVGVSPGYRLTETGDDDDIAKQPACSAHEYFCTTDPNIGRTLT
jgi:hypothetical protein